MSNEYLDSLGKGAEDFLLQRLSDEKLPSPQASAVVLHLHARSRKDNLPLARKLMHYLDDLTKDCLNRQTRFRPHDVLPVIADLGGIDAVDYVATWCSKERLGNLCFTGFDGQVNEETLRFLVAKGTLSSLQYSGTLRAESIIEYCHDHPPLNFAALDDAAPRLWAMAEQAMGNELNRMQRYARILDNDLQPPPFNRFHEDQCLFENPDIERLKRAPLEERAELIYEIRYRFDDGVRLHLEAVVKDFVMRSGAITESDRAAAFQAISLLSARGGIPSRTFLSQMLEATESADANMAFREAMFFWAYIALARASDTEIQSLLARKAQHPPDFVRKRTLKKLLRALRHDVRKTF